MDDHSRPDNRNPRVWKPSDGFKLALAFVLGGAAGVLFERNSIHPAFEIADRQRINLIVVERLLPDVQAVLDGDPRFKEVRAGTYTGMDGAIGIYGHVATPDDQFALMKAVADLDLPIAIYWRQLRVGGGEL